MNAGLKTALARILYIDKKEKTMRTVHILKLNSNFAMAVLKGLKTFEIRKNDRDGQNRNQRNLQGRNLLIRG